MNPVLKVIKMYRERTLDPVKNCLVYRAVGCAHVDGMLCNMRTCDIKVHVAITPTATKEIGDML